MPFFPVDLSIPPLPPVQLPPTPEVIDVPADLPALEPDIVISFPLSEQVMDMVVVPAEQDGQDVIYVAVSQERVNVWAALVYFTPEIALGVTALVVLVALRKFWVTRRFTHRKGETYCKKYWAGLTGVQSETCPECGRAIKKTRRTAKRSKRSLAHPRWRWALAALLFTLGTTTLWFGEAWHGLYKHGFTPEQPADWWALLDPVDRDSPIRINQAAGWFSWYSADLAKHARENDAAWMERLSWEYHKGKGVRYGLLVRRYSTGNDGKLLTEATLPDDCPGQDQYEFNSPLVTLYHLNGVVIVDDNVRPYRYRHDAEQSWVLIGDRDKKIRLETLAVTPDGRHFVFGQVLRQRGAEYRITDDDLCIAVYDANTGALVTKLQTIYSTRRMAALEPQMRVVVESWPPQYEVEYPAYSFVPLERGNLLVFGTDAIAEWRYEDREFTPVVREDYERLTFRDDLWVRLQTSSSPIRDYRLLPLHRSHFRRILIAAHQ